MAYIAIFCDGTWNSAQMGGGTHVLRLSQDCARSDSQKVFYFQGVGTGKGHTGRLDRWIDKIGGGLFGWGLNRNIKAAYAALCKTYQPGDKIMIFGFSRGAYTARSLVGMIRKCGIVQFPTDANVARAFRLYRLRGPQNTPDAPHIRAMRRKLSPHIATSQADVIARGDDSGLVRIAYLGVWDTVGALGIPESLFGRIARWWNKRYEFHDTRLSHLVESARHAVALDERRVFYKPSLWENLSADSDHPGLNGGDEGPARAYQQTWFVGDHGIVGGVGAACPLSAMTLSWIWEGAGLGGLRLRPGVKLAAGKTDAVVHSCQMARRGLMYRIFKRLLQWRAGPEHTRDLDDSARMRLASLPSYRPGSLFHLMPGLAQRS
ncbi:hypothetical protein ROLI_025030 [Roseobacter fucihabitans]|uniref:T6SS Phospholipase effector Tle1-like catalytic domain-containing protein n=1 Tax=Roseobacter fucihabitans TaxID=1537242 RepID=A0ABZ2BTL4_9RHOB|nr:DUF2235 domain-containing protein [Roseobacter litoralis]MBC6965193.1 hypothetical protein [Roseobacter litoralis]